MNRFIQKEEEKPSEDNQKEEEKPSGEETDNKDKDEPSGDKDNPDDTYPSSGDNFSPVMDGGKIDKLVLDFSNVAKSKVDPSDLRMTVIKGTRFTTAGRLKDKDSISTTGGVTAKVSPTTLIPRITCKSDGSASLTMEDGITYTVIFRVENPKPNKYMKIIKVGSGRITRNVSELFKTSIDGGTLTAASKKNASAVTVSGNTLIIDPEGKDTIKVEYRYLNKKYKLKINVVQ